MKKFIIFLSLIIMVASCQRDNLDEFNDISQSDEPNIIVESSVVGLILDDDGNGVSNAVVSLGALNTFTNEVGVFSFQDELISQDAGYIQVEKNGYFLGSRKFSSELNGTTNIRVQLIRKELSDIVSTQIGGSVQVEGCSIELPAGNYRKVNGENYIGDVEVFAKWLDPTALETFDQMPGELTGIDKEGNLSALATYGMLGVELQSSQGEYLNLPEGETATIKMLVPNELLASAPNVIPLWHFNEFSGNWEEEGEAILIGNEYVGQVSHFSFWNCDAPFPFVEISGYLSLDDNPYESGQLKINDLSSGFCTFGYTGEGGYFTVKVPKGKDLKLAVIGPCGISLVDIDLGSFNIDTQIGDVLLDGNIETVSVSGTFDNCMNGEIEIAFAVIQSNEFHYTIPIESDGSFQQVFPGCSGSTTVEIYGIDVTNSMISLVQEENFEGEIELLLEVCEGYFVPEINIQYEGKNWELQDTFLNDYLSSVEVINAGSDENYFIQVFGTDWDIFNPLILLPVVDCDFYYNPNEDDVTYMITFPTQGFRIEGECEATVINQGVFDLIQFQGVHVGEIEVLDLSTYPGNIEEVIFDVIVKI